MGTESAHEPLDIRIPVVVAQLERVAASQGLQAVWQLGLHRGPGIIDQQRNHPAVSLECQLKLDPVPVSRIIEAPAAPVVTCREPTWPNQGQDNNTLAEGVGDRLRPVLARGDTVLVAKNRPLAKLPCERFAQPSGDHLRVTAAIADEELRHFSPARIIALRFAARQKVGGGQTRSSVSEERSPDPRAG